jgi:hypothetical protein
MEGSGSNVNQLLATYQDGKEVRVNIISAGDVVEIGGWCFHRDDLIWAIGITTADLEEAKH